MSKKDEKREAVIKVLNIARAMELHGIIQYMNHHFFLDDENFGPLATKIKKIAIDEMKHAEKFAERIKDLGGDPTSEPAQKTTHGHKIEELYPFDAALEENTIEKYNEFMQVCRDNGDVISARIFETIAEQEQEHFDYFDDTGRHVKELGKSFLARNAGEEED